MKTAVQKLASRLDKTAAAGTVNIPVKNLADFLSKNARVRLRDGSYAAYGFDGRRPLRFVAELLDKIIRNTAHQETVQIDGVTYTPGALKGSTVSVCGGAQFGKTVIELNFGGYVTTVEMLNFGYYTSDKELLSTIVDTKFRPDVVDQIDWMRSMIQVGKSESKSGRSVDRKNAFQVSNGPRKAFGYFNGMQRPPTTISLDIAVLDEVDDIPEKNIGFISGRMTTSAVQLTCYIGTQRIHGAGQNARWRAGTMHKWVVQCQGCGHDICLEEGWPGVTRVAVDGHPAPTDPKLDETMAYDPDATYYPACPDCGAQLDPDAGFFRAAHPGRERQRNWSIRIAQMDVPAIPWRDLVVSWFNALIDPNPEAIAAWHCDRRAIPHAGAMQPITPEIVNRSITCSTELRSLSDIALAKADAPCPLPYSMSLARLRSGTLRVAGMDMGPRCWLWVNEILDANVSALVWAEMIPSGTAFGRVAELMAAGSFDCIFLDAGGEPDLTKRIVLALNGLDTYRAPMASPADLRAMTMSNIGAGVTWNGSTGQWQGLRAAAVDFSLREAGGIQHHIGHTQDGQIYPLIKANRAESIQGIVNDFLTPKEGVIQLVPSAGSKPALRTLPRQRLPEKGIGPGVPESLVATHLQNLRRIKDPVSGQVDWADQVENHLGLAAAYARLGAMVRGSATPIRTECSEIKLQGHHNAYSPSARRAILL